MADSKQVTDRNPCELAIDLFCRGARLETVPEGSIARTRAGLGSGLELVLPGRRGPGHRGRDVWVNVPVVEDFAHQSPLRLTVDGLVDERSGRVYPVRLPDEPAWYRQTTRSGMAMGEIGRLQGTYLGIYLGRTCAFWQDALQCHFCTTGLNRHAAKSVADVVETARAARAESGITFVHLNTGYQRGAACRLVAPYVEAIKRELGLLVGVQVMPEAPLQEFDELRRRGADHFSFCFEYFGKEDFRRRCPGKHQTVGQEAYFRALEHCQARMPRGSCSGEIIAGNEPIEHTLAAIDYITSVGAFPTVCIFRPLQGSTLEHEAPPRYEDMRTVMAHVWRACRDRGIPIGVARNVEVSLVIQPSDTAYLARGGWRDAWYRARLALWRNIIRVTSKA